MKSPNWENSNITVKQSQKSNNCGRKRTGRAKMGTAMHAMFEYYYNKIKPEIIESYEGTKEHEYFEFYPRSSTTKTVPYRMECLR